MDVTTKFYVRDMMCRQCEKTLEHAVGKVAGVKSVKADYGNYLKRRIRPAMENLLLEENIPKMEILEQQGWFGRKELDSFIQIAREQGRLESLVWLMLLKDQKYGYDEPDFTL